MAFVVPSAAIFVVFLTNIVCVKDVNCRKTDTGIVLKCNQPNI